MKIYIVEDYILGHLGVFSSKEKAYEEAAEYIHTHLESSFDFEKDVKDKLKELFNKAVWTFDDIVAYVNYWNSLGFMEGIGKVSIRENELNKMYVNKKGV